jgi:hypothetical protein
MIACLTQQLIKTVVTTYLIVEIDDESRDEDSCFELFLLVFKIIWALPCIGIECWLGTTAGNEHRSIIIKMCHLPHFGHSAFDASSS